MYGEEAADPALYSLWGCWQAGEQSITSLFANGASKDQVNAEWQQLVPHLDDVARYNLGSCTVWASITQSNRQLRLEYHEREDRNLNDKLRF